MAQRDLARLLRVAPSTIARAELPRGSIALDLLLHTLAAAGLRLVVVDAETGQELPVEDPDTVKNQGGARFPAHLDIEPVRYPGWLARDKGRERQVTFRHRETRDERASRGDPRPYRHLTRPEVWWALLPGEAMAAHHKYTTWSRPFVVEMWAAGLGRHSWYAPRPASGYTPDGRPLHSHGVGIPSLPGHVRRVLCLYGPPEPSTDDPPLREYQRRPLRQ